MKKLFVLALFIGAIAGGIYLFGNVYRTTLDDHSIQNGVNTMKPTITFSNAGFSPSDLEVKAGTTVTIRNTSNSTLQMQSNEHPTHTDNNELNLGIIDAGTVRHFVVNNKGSFGYHNHLAPSQGARITVQ